MDNSNTNNNQAPQSTSIMNFLAAKKIEASMFAMRIYILILSIQFLFFASPYQMQHYFQRALLANAVVCALRIHQRVPVFRFSKEYIATCLMEDAAHYLMYSFVFLSCKPMTLALIPIAGFALMHVCSFSRKLFDLSGPNSYAFMRKITNMVAKNQETIFRVIAMTEAMLMPIMIIQLISGNAGLLSPFLYYKFVQYRYMSRRNPYCRLAFYETKMTLQQFTMKPSCPSIVKNIINKGINITCKLAPQVVQQQQ